MHALFPDITDSAFDGIYLGSFCRDEREVTRRATNADAP